MQGHDLHNVHGLGQQGWYKYLGSVRTLAWVAIGQSTSIKDERFQVKVYTDQV